MTDFEIASLAIQEAGFALQETSLTIQEAHLAIQKANLALQESSLAYHKIAAWASVVSAVAAAIAAFGIWHGIREMVRAGRERAIASDQRHKETMTALMELIRRTSAAPARAGD